MSKQDEIERLDEQIEQALSVLTPRQRKFALKACQPTRTENHLDVSKNP